MIRAGVLVDVHAVLLHAHHRAVELGNLHGFLELTRPGSTAASA